MKKLIFILVILFAVFGTNVYSACDPGWTSANFSYLYDSNNDGNPDCPITVYYCYIVLPSGVFHIKVDEVKVRIPCGINLLINPNFWGDLENRLLDHLNQNGSFPPCPLLAFNVKVWRAKCWKIQNDPNHNQLIAINCGYLSYCEKIIEICYDSQQGKNVMTIVQVNSIGTPDCSDEMPMLPPLLKTWDDEWTTGCYGVNCF